MNHLTRIICLFFFLQLYCFPVKAQTNSKFFGYRSDEFKNHLLGLRQHTSQGFSHYDYSGQFKFRLPPGHTISLPDVDEDENFYNADFSYGVVPVTTKNGFYLINSNGQTLKEIKGNFKYVDPVDNGYIIALRILPDESYQKEYYDITGTKMMGNYSFSTGANVIYDVALVRVNSPGKPLDNDWILVSRSGEILKNITEATGKNLKYFADTYDTYWRLSIEGERNKLYVLPDGKTTTDNPQVQSTSTYSPLYARADSLAKAKQLTTTSILRSWRSYMLDDKLYFMTYEPGVPSRVLDQDLNEVIIAKEGSQLRPYSFYGSYVLMEEMKEGKVASLHLYNLETRKISTRIPNYPDEVIGNLFIYNVSLAFQDMVEKIITGEGKIIYNVPESDRYVSTIADVKLKRDSVKLLELHRPNFFSLSEIRVLPRVEVFELSEYAAADLPESFFTDWNHLEFVRFTDCENLTKLPESMKGLPKLRELHLVNCDEVGDFSAWIETWPSITLVHSMYAPSQEVEEKYPHIQFDYMFYRDE